MHVCYARASSELKWSNAAMMSEYSCPRLLSIEALKAPTSIGHPVDRQDENVVTS